MAFSSRRGIMPLGVLMTMAIWPFLIMSTALGRPSLSLASRFAATPLSVRYFAVPLVE